MRTRCREAAGLLPEEQHSLSAGHAHEGGVLSDLVLVAVVLVHEAVHLVGHGLALVHHQHLLNVDVAFRVLCTQQQRGGDVS